MFRFFDPQANVAPAPQPGQGQGHPNAPQGQAQRPGVAPQPVQGQARRNAPQAQANPALAIQAHLIAQGQSPAKPELPTTDEPTRGRKM